TSDEASASKSSPKALRRRSRPAAWSISNAISARASCSRAPCPPAGFRHWSSVGPSGPRVRRDLRSTFAWWRTATEPGSLKARRRQPAHPADPREGFGPLVGFVDAILDVRQHRAFQPRARAYPGLVRHDGHPAELVQLAEQRHGSCHVTWQTGQLEPVDTLRLDENVHLLMPRHQRIEAVHDF